MCDSRHLVSNKGGFAGLTSLEPEPNVQEGNDTAKRGSAKRQKVLIDDSEASEGEERAPKGRKKLPKRLRFDNVSSLENMSGDSQCRILNSPMMS